MPTFLPNEAFDRDRMNDAERARFDAAVLAYDEIQRANQQQQANDNPDMATLILMAGYHRPGPKSALFHRLLSGKPALPAAPPTSFSYPWYDVIEGDGPFPVMIDASLGRNTPADSPRTVMLNQCRWTVEEANPAAQALDAFLNDDRTGHLSDDAWHEQAKALLAQRPVWTVRHGAWPAFHLFMGRRVSQALRAALVTPLCHRDLEGARPVVTAVLQYAAFSDAGTSPAESGDDWVAYEADGWQIQRALPR